MKTIAILAHPNSIASDVLTLLDYFEFSNALWRFLQPESQQQLFHAYVVSPDAKPLQLRHGLQLAVQPHDWSQADAAVFTPGYAYDAKGLQQLVEQSSCYYPKLPALLEQGAILAASCTGTYALAGSGLLNHRQATSSWFFKDVFQSMFPQVHLQLNKVLVMDQQLLTAGATTSHHNLCLALTEKLAGEQFARQMAKLMLTDPNRSSQLPYMDADLLPANPALDPLMKQARRYLLANLAEPFSLQQLADQLHLTKRTLLRRFKAELKETPLNYLQRLRIEQAKRLLETSRIPIEQVVLQVGYEDVSSFRKLFLQYTELTPSQYRQKFLLEPNWSCCPQSTG